MRGPDDHPPQQPVERLQGGPSRPPLLQRIPAPWRRYAVAVLAFAFGIALGGGVVHQWQAQPEPAPHQVDEHAVELVLYEAVPPRTRSDGGDSESRWLWVDSGVLLSGVVTSTVLTVNGPDPSLDVHVPALPVRVTPDARLQAVGLRIAVRDCEVATRWRPVDRPFTLTWRDEYGKEHTDSVGDFDRSVANALIRHIHTLCGDRPNR